MSNGEEERVAALAERLPEGVRVRLPGGRRGTIRPGLWGVGGTGLCWKVSRYPHLDCVSVLVDEEDQLSLIDLFPTWHLAADVTRECED